MKITKKSLTVFLFFILFLNACAKNQQSQQQPTQKTIQTISSKDISALTPEQVVILYFQSWNDKKYDDGKKEFSSTYTLKKKTNGWKLIHPYGNNIDKS